MASRQIRPIRVEGNIAYVPLTQGHEAIIDAADVPLVQGQNWRALVSPRTVYAARWDRPRECNRLVLLHRLIVGAPTELEVDHINGDGLNNQRLNLRLATRSQNKRNQRIAKNNASGVKGVCWYEPNGKWLARIMCDGRAHHLGYFHTIDAAAAAYAAASRDLHGEFGRTA